MAGRYLRAMTWYMEASENARPRVIRGTRAKPLPLLPSGPGGVCGRPLHGARGLTKHDFSMVVVGGTGAGALGCVPISTKRSNGPRPTLPNTATYRWGSRSFTACPRIM